MSTHAQRLGRGLRATAQVSLTLTAAALSVALGAGPAAAAPSGPNPPPNPNPEPGPAAPAEPGPAAPQDRAPEQTEGADATVTGFVWEDVNHNGIQDTAALDTGRRAVEQGVPDVPVIVLVKQADDEKLPEVVRKVRATAPAGLARLSASLPSGFRAAKTDADGKYSIGELPAGAARVLVLPNGTGGSLDLDKQWRVTKLHQGKDRDLDSDFMPKVDNLLQLVRFGVANTVLKAAKPVVLDAGIINPRRPADNGVVCVNAWNDKNRNGLREKAEEPIAGLPVGLLPLPDPKLSKLSKQLTLRAPGAARRDDTDVTNKNGRFCFRDVRAGKYRAVIGLGPVVTDENGDADIDKVWTLTKANVGTDEALDSDFTLLPPGNLPTKLDGKVGATDVIVVKDDTKTTVDAGLFKDEPTPTPSETPTPTPTPTPPATGGGSLPVTGAALGGLLAAGALLLGGGVVMTILGRRRRRTTA